MTAGLMSRMQPLLPVSPTPPQKPLQGQVGWESHHGQRQKPTEASSSVKVVGERFRGISRKASKGRGSAGPWEKNRKIRSARGSVFVSLTFSFSLSLSR